MLLIIVSMSRKSGLDIKKAILEELKEKECSLRELETKTNTGYSSIKRHCEELAFLKIVELIHHNKSDANGRPFKTARITDSGKRL